MKLVGGAIGREACTDVRRGNRIYLIEDDLPLIHFLSSSRVNLFLLPTFIAILYPASWYSCRTMDRVMTGYLL